MSNSEHFGSWEEAVRWLRSQPDKQDLVEGAYYDDPLASAAQRYFSSEEWRAVRHFLPVSGKALDVGAGRGIASYALAKEGFLVTALEPDASDLVGAGAIRALAKECALPITVCQEFSEELPFPDSTFEVVFARAVLHHTRDLQAACEEFFRVLKPGGVLIAVREHVISRQEDLPAFLDIHPLHKLYGGENAFVLDQYVGAIGKAGFKLERMLTPLESPINFAPYTKATLEQELAQRMTRGVPLLYSLVCALLRMPVVWKLALPVLTRIDHRPGRLYSFVCRRP